MLVTEIVDGIIWRRVWDDDDGSLLIIMSSTNIFSPKFQICQRHPISVPNLKLKTYFFSKSAWNSECTGSSWKRFWSMNQKLWNIFCFRTSAILELVPHNHQIYHIYDIWVYWLDLDLIPRLLENFENWKNGHFVKRQKWRLQTNFSEVDFSFRVAYPMQFTRKNIRVF